MALKALNRIDAVVPRSNVQFGMKFILVILLFSSALAMAAPAEGVAPRLPSEALFDTNIFGKIPPASSNLPRSGTLLSTPVILVSPAALNFGTVITNQSATNTFLVENAGGGRLFGRATVPPPFEVIEGGAYSLGRTEAQVVTVRYLPRRLTGSNDVQSVMFSGGKGFKAIVSGTPAPRKPR